MNNYMNLEQLQFFYQEVLSIIGDEDTAADELLEEIRHKFLCECKYPDPHERWGYCRKCEKRIA